MSALTLINGSIRKLPILLRILVIGAVSTALTYVMAVSYTHLRAHET